jgi:hypothetical protein
MQTGRQNVVVQGVRVILESLHCSNTCSHIEFSTKPTEDYTPPAFRAPIRVFDQKKNILVAYFPGGLETGVAGKRHLHEETYEAVCDFSDFCPTNRSWMTDPRHCLTHDPSDPHTNHKVAAWRSVLQEKGTACGTWHFGVKQIQSRTDGFTANTISGERIVVSHEKARLLRQISLQRVFALMGAYYELACPDIAQQQRDAFTAMPPFCKNAWSDVKTNRHFAFLALVKVCCVCLSMIVASALWNN